MTRSPLPNLSTAVRDETFYWFVSDGHCLGTEFVWCPVARRWLYYDLDSHQASSSSELILVVSDTNGDESGLNQLDQLVTCEFTPGYPGLWITTEEPTEIPDDTEVYRLGDPSDRLTCLTPQYTEAEAP